MSMLLERLDAAVRVTVMSEAKYAEGFRSLIKERSLELRQEILNGMASRSRGGEINRQGKCLGE